MLDEGNDGSVLSRRYGVEIEIAKAQLQGERAEFERERAKFESERAEMIMMEVF